MIKIYEILLITFKNSISVSICFDSSLILILESVSFFFSTLLVEFCILSDVSFVVVVVIIGLDIDLEGSFLVSTIDSDLDCFDCSFLDFTSSTS